MKREIILAWVLLMFIITPAFADKEGHHGCGDYHHGSEQANAHSADEFLDEYFSIQKALSEDSLEEAKDKASELLPKLEDHGKLKTASEELSQAADIESARKSFEVLSKGLIAMVKNNPPKERVVFEVHCPMAAGGDGANWLQKEREVGNPYFGSQMYACGEVKNTYGSDKAGHSPS